MKRKSNNACCCGRHLALQLHLAMTYSRRNKSEELVELTWNKVISTVSSWHHPRDD